MKQLLEAFRFADVQTAITLWKHLKNQGKSFEDLEEYIKENPKDPRGVTRTQSQRVPVKSCPNCNNELIAFSVNTRKCNQVGGNYKYQWLCNKCEYEEFTKEI